MTEEINNNTMFEKNIIDTPNKDEIEEPIKKRRGRPSILNRIPKQYKPKDPDYFKKYYHSSKLSDIINCPICSRTVTKIHLKNHMKSSLCKPTLKSDYLETIAYHSETPEMYNPPSLPF